MSIPSFQLTFRRLQKDKLHSWIKVVGLTMGMACMLLAILFVQDEYSFDRFHANSPRLFRLTTSINDPRNGGFRIMGATGQVQGPAFQERIPEIEQSVRVMAGLSTNFIANETPLMLDFVYADPNFFQVFSFPFLQGNPLTALDNLNSVVITESTARRFFGKTNVLGKTIYLEEGHGMANFLITGVVKSLPVHSSIQFEAVLPFRYLQTMFPDKGWINVYLSTFVLLRPHADLQKVENEFSAVVKEAAGAELGSANLSPDQVHFGLQPIANIHLNIFEKGPIPEIGRGNLQEANVVTYSYLLMGISGFILIMAAANFINLSVAGSLKRSKEIGIRKIAGAAQWQIVRQFLGEASLICGISFLLALLSVWGILPVFNQLAGKQIHLPLTGVVLFILEGLGLMIVCTLVVGIYPAIKSSMFSAADTLYNRQKWKGKNGFSKGLMVFQFSLAVSLLSGTIIYYRQMNFISQHDAGYDASGIVQIDLPVFRNINQQAISVFRNELMSQASVKQVSNGQLTPGATVDVHNAGRTISAQKCKVDPFFLPTLSILLLGGRNFSPQFASDSSQSIIVNETLVRTEGWQDPIGRQIQIVDGMGNWDTRTIVGVVKDYHYASLKKKIDPLILEMGQSENVWIKLNKGLTVQGLAGIKNLFTKNFPQYFYQAELLEEDNSNQYTNEQRWKEIISFAAGISLTICCMGLFGVAHFITIKRTKEIGIRKVLGASAWHISALLTRNFLWLVLLSLLIAWPVGWFGMSRWLENFSYRIQITWLDFALTGVLALLITVATVLSQALKTATANPVTSLRTE